MSDTCRCSGCRGASSRVPANTGSHGAARKLRGRAPAPPARRARGWMREQAACRGFSRAYRNTHLGFRGRENFFAVFHLVVHGLGGGEEGFVRTLAQQVVRKVQLVE